METRVLKVLTNKDIQKIQHTVSSWRAENGYEDIEGYCKSSTTEEIEKNNFVLTPGRYVGFADQEEDDESFDQKMKRLTTLLNQQQDEGAKLDQQIAENLKRIGYV